MPIIHFYFDFVSPYAYVAFHALPRTLAGLPYQVVHRPLVLGALLKAHGHGISFGLHKLRFAPAGAGALQLAWCDAGLGDAARWQLHEWQAAEDFRAALAWYPLL